MVIVQWFKVLLESVGLRFCAHDAGGEGSLFFPSCSKACAADGEAASLHRCCGEYADADEERYRYLDEVRDIHVQHSTGCSSSGSSSSTSTSSMASSGFRPLHVTDSYSTVLQCEAPVLRELACRMVSDGFARALIRAFGREPDGVLKRWFYELGVNEALRINVQDKDGALQLPGDDRLLVRGSLPCWTRGLILMSEALSATQHHLRCRRILVSDDGTGTVASKGDPDGLQLVRFAEASISKMLGFADVELAHGSPTENLWVLLNLLVHVSKAEEIIMPSLMEECRSVGSLEMKGLVKKMGNDFSWRKDKLCAAIWDTMHKFKGIISSKASWDTIPDDEEVHETTELTLEYLTMLWANNSVLNSIVLCFSESWHQTSTADMIAGMIHELERQLEEESKSLPNPSLRYIFLLNNCDFIEQRFNQFHFASEHVVGIHRKLASYLKSYLDISWEPVLSCLQRKGATTAWLQIKKRCFPLEEFQLMLVATCRAQKLWKVPNPTLRRTLREAITEKVAGAYTAYLRSSSSPRTIGRGTRIVKRVTLFKKVGSKLIQVPGTWNVAPYHVPGDYGSSNAFYLQDMLNELFEG